MARWLLAGCSLGARWLLAGCSLGVAEQPSVSKLSEVEPQVCAISRARILSPQPTVAPPGHHLAQGFTGDKGAPDSWNLTA